MKVLIASLGLVLAMLYNHASVRAEQDVKHENEFASETSFSSEEFTLPLAINVEPGTELYHDPMWAIKIVDIWADGQRVTEKRSGIYLDDINIESGIVNSRLFIYKIRISVMLFGDISSNGDYEVVKYSIPKDVKTLKISYRFADYNGSIDPRVYTVRAFRTR
ncbi:hypothetical protein AAFN88_16660 [Pelagibius sp. CAU 1746]|uniref:hypothetical protein n=1 Tax=Pelagibius sp. CAU 1746 TaxID=3140370 RepID=UPI00325BCCFF